MSIERARALLRDRELKDGARGTDDIYIGLDDELVNELEALQADLAAAEAAQTARQDLDERPRRPRLGDAAPAADGAEENAELAELRAKVATKEDEVRAVSMRLHFVALGSAKYRSIQFRHPDADGNNQARVAFMSDVVEACLREVWIGDEQVEGLTWAEISEPLTFGEWQQIALRVIALNQKTVDVPFSLRSSGTTRG